MRSGGGEVPRGVATDGAPIRLLGRGYESIDAYFLDNTSIDEKLRAQTILFKKKRRVHKGRRLTNRELF